MADPNSSERLRDSVRHTEAFYGTNPQQDTTSHDACETALGEDWATTSNILNELVGITDDVKLESAQHLLAPRVIAGIKLERDYRRVSQQSVKKLGSIVGRHLYGGIVHHDNAAKMLREFIDVTIQNQDEDTKVGLELGHIELAGSGISVNEAWRQLDNMAEEVSKNIPHKVIDAHHLPPSHRAASFNAIVNQNGEDVEVKLPRARTNFPVFDIGHTGIQLFVRAAVGYDRVSMRPIELQSVREAHETYMRKYAKIGGFVRIYDDDDIFAYPQAATLVAFQRNS